MKSSRSAVCFFAGPSVQTPQFEVECGTFEADVTILPPVQQGDLLRLGRHLPDVVGIIDGYFLSVPAVLHKEILWLLENGVRVLGASSMGALRAAELDLFGMEGVGQIYRMYKSGVIDGDDEVALLHVEAEGGYRAVTEPLVNLRHTLDRAWRRGVISARTRKTIVRAAKSLSFMERSESTILANARTEGAPEEELARLEAFSREYPEDLKAQDALTLARTIARRLRGCESWPPRVDFRLNRTLYHHLFEREYLGELKADQTIPDSLVLSFQKLLDPSFSDSLRRATQQWLILDEARTLGLICAPDDELAGAFTSTNDLESEAALDRWLADRHLSPGEWLDALRDRDLEAQVLARCQERNPEEGDLEVLRSRIASGVLKRTACPDPEEFFPILVNPGVPGEGILLRSAKMDGGFRSAFGRAARIMLVNRRFSRKLPGLREALSEDRIEGWVAGRWGIEAAQLDRAIIARGFLSYREFIDTAGQAFICECLEPGPTDTARPSSRQSA